MKLAVLILQFLAGTSLFAQDINLNVISAGGGFVSKANGSLSWTFGEPVTGTIKNGSYTITQGFQQSKIIVSGVSEELPATCSIRAYPVPATDYINIECELDRESGINFELTDLNGKNLLKSFQNSKASLFTADISKIPAGTYILKVSFSDGRYYKNIKVVKIN